VVVQWEGRVRVGPLADASAEAVSEIAAPGEQLHPDVSADGDRIAFAVDDSDGTRDVWTADLATGVATLLVDCVAPCGWADDPVWSPDGTRIAYETGTEVDGVGVGRVEVIPAAGGSPEVAWTSPSTEYPFGLAWSPDGRSLAVESVRFASTSLWEERALGSVVGIIGPDRSFRALTEFGSGLGYPDWSPDGSAVVVSGDDLWLLPVDGGEATRLTDVAADGGRALQADWSPDGSELVFVYEIDGDPRVAVIPVAGGDPLVGGPGTHPRFVPVA
jgi:Tol biopolymer transport system component